MPKKSSWRRKYQSKGLKEVKEQAARITEERTFQKQTGNKERSIFQGGKQQGHHGWNRGDEGREVGKVKAVGGRRSGVRSHAAEELLL